MTERELSWGLVKELEAEVEELRATAARLKELRELDAAQHALDESSLATAVAEMSRLRKAGTASYESALNNAAQLTDALVRMNAAERVVAWFEERESRVRTLFDDPDFDAVEAFGEWERTNPKP